MTISICCACGTSYPDSEKPPERCAICEDERQFVPRRGQSWISPEDLADSHANLWRRHQPGLFEIRTHPDFAIGQRAFLVRTGSGSILWDCIALLDDATEEIVRALGGLQAIAISHPHYYTRMQDWARVFDVPVHLHARDRAWVMRPDPRLTFWEGEAAAIGDGLTLLRPGGHFPGGTVLHWAGGADGAGVLFSGDIVQVTPGGKRVSFMWSYPNLMPLSAQTVRRLTATLAPWRFERIYGAFAEREIAAGASTILTTSAGRYIELLEGEQG